MGDDKLEFAVDQNRMGGGGGRNGWAEPYFDADAGVPMLKMFDLSVLESFGSSDRKLTKQELFEALWSRIVKRLEA
jgi:hypothetical protein